jgi:CMP-N,N'-diacetyllegionaminic acid synthase
VIEGLRVLALIPARGGSKGLPGKNILPVGGRPLLSWTIGTARASRYVDRVVLSSDDPVTIEVAEREGCEVPFRRDATLATDEATSVDVVIDAIERLPGYDIIVLLQPTSPLRTAQDIDGVLALLCRRDADFCVSVRRAEEHPYWTFLMDVSGCLVPYCARPDGILARRQSLPDAWCLNGAVYAARIAPLLEARSFINAKTVAYAMPADRSLDIDTQADLERFEQLLRERNVTPLAAAPTPAQPSPHPNGST